MATLIKELKNSRSIIFDKGRFDNWCVFIVESNKSKLAPLDVNYFKELVFISKSYEKARIYNDFIAIYELTTSLVDEYVLKLIEKLSATYLPAHQFKMEQWLTVLYAGMIAEENKEKAILKKRIKRLGMYQILCLDMPPEDAAKFSIGKKWQELNEMMKAYGF